MQIQLFTIPIGDNSTALQEMNAFLRGNKILEVQNQLISNENGAYWCFCIRYIEQPTKQPDGKNKIDYREVLDEATFQRFSKLREIRKKAASDEGVSAFVVFTDEELAELAKLEMITEASMSKIKGIGDKKVARFGKYFITNLKNDETAGKTN